MFLLSSLLAKLPTSLLVTSLALAASALPVESVELKVLTPDNFDTTVADGAWFIEHYSPYCHHCKAFAPTWEKLVQHYESMDDPGVHFAQVNCAANGDLCSKHGVTGYPQMNMYKNGKMVEQYKSPREWDTLISFVNRHAAHTPKELPAHLDTSPSKPPPNPEGMVKALDPTNFVAYLEQGPAFIKFYAPWCGHCKKLAPVWTQLAAQLRNKLNVAEVNCELYKDLCKAQDVKGFPTLYFYSGGSVEQWHKTEYTSGRKLEQMRRFAEMAIAPTVQEIDSERDYEHYVHESSVLYLFLHSPDDKQSLSDLKEASRILLGSPKILASSNPEIRRRFSIPATYSSTPILLAIKDGIPNAYTSLFAFSPLSSSQSPSKTKSQAQKKEEKEKLRDWLLRNRLPSAIALKEETFQDVMTAPHQPLVVIAAVDPKKEAEGAEKVTEVARLWREMLEREHVTDGVRAKDVVFTWMDAEKWGSWIKSMYGIKSPGEHGETPVIITDHAQLIYYDTNAKGNKIALEVQSVTEAVKDVLAGKVSYKNSENLIERIARRINDLLMYLEQTVVTHPYRSALFFLVFVVFLVMGLKRLIADDAAGVGMNGAGGMSFAEYTRMQKDSSRLD